MRYHWRALRGDRQLQRPAISQSVRRKPSGDDITRAETLDKAHGRIETRRIAVSAEVIEHLGWPGASQVARVWRERRIGDKVSSEVAYFVTSLPVAKAGPDRLLALVRAHWGVENRLRNQATH